MRVLVELDVDVMEGHPALVLDELRESLEQLSISTRDGVSAYVVGVGKVEIV